MIGKLNGNKTPEPVIKAYWKDVGYGFFRLYVGKFTGEVGWDHDALKVTFEGHVLVKRFLSLDEAKKACEQLAKTILEEALQAVLVKMNL